MTERMTAENQIPATMIEQIEIMIAVGGLSPAQEVTFKGAAKHIEELEAEYVNKLMDKNDIIKELEGMFGVSRDSHLAANKRIKELEAKQDRNTQKYIAALDCFNKLEARLDAMDEPVSRLNSWCRAYPYDVFIEVEEPDWKKANKVLKEAGISMTAMNGSNMRHVVNGVKEIADALLAALGEKE
jgi:hypothetical protein